MTDAERKLWFALRSRQLSGMKFRRQKPVGPYIADFACAEAKLVVEVDGGQHYCNVEADQRRTAAIEKLGWHVIRLSNLDVLNNLNGAFEMIAQAASKTAHALTASAPPIPAPQQPAQSHHRCDR